MKKYYTELFAKMWTSMKSRKAKGMALMIAALTAATAAFAGYAHMNKEGLGEKSPPEIAAMANDLPIETPKAEDESPPAPEFGCLVDNQRVLGAKGEVVGCLSDPIVLNAGGGSSGVTLKETL